MSIWFSGIGSRIEFPLLQWGTEGVNLIQINTDVDELDRHGIGALGIHGDAAEVVPLLLDRLADVQRPDRRVPSWPRSAPSSSRDIAYLEPQLSYLAAIRDALPDDAILVEDVTQMTFVAHFAYQFNQPRTFLSSGFAGTLGAGNRDRDRSQGRRTRSHGRDDHRRRRLPVHRDRTGQRGATSHPGDHRRVQRQRLRQRATNPAGAVRCRTNDRFDVGQPRHRRVRQELRLSRSTCLQTRTSSPTRCAPRWRTTDRW